MHRSRSTRLTRAPWKCALPLALLSACGGSATRGGASGIPGQEDLKPDGTAFFVDPNQSGRSDRLALAEITWGRLVDVYEVDAAGTRVQEPVFRDFVVDPGLASDGTRFVLERDPVRQHDRLTVLATKRATSDPSLFDRWLEEAASGVVPVRVAGPSSAPPFSVIPRDACLVLRFDDCLADGSDSALELPELVRVVTGYPADRRFQARVLFDPNHGALVGGEFHATRVLLDMTVSRAEADELPGTQPLQVLGLPPRDGTSPSANVVLRLPTRTDPGSGQHEVLRSLGGKPLQPAASGPVDEGSPTLDVVRGLRSGSGDEPNRGFLRDDRPPRLLGAWPITVTRAVPEPASGERDFRIDLDFSGACRAAPQAGDLVAQSSALLEVVAPAALAGSTVTGLHVRAREALPAAVLLGSGSFHAPYTPSAGLALSCWVELRPDPGAAPVDVDPHVAVVARFDEPMDPGTLSPFDGFLLVEGPAASESAANSCNTVLCKVEASEDLTVFTLSHDMPLPHLLGRSETFHLELNGARDPAGNELRNALPQLELLASAQSPSALGRAIVLRFRDADEYSPSGGPDGRRDLRGQFLYDTRRGTLFARPVALTSWPIDRTNPVPRAMTALGTGTREPLNPRGARLQALWRYCDLGWQVLDETKHNLDVLGLSWAPLNGQVVTDFFEQFEIRLGHARFLPDEGATLKTSGLPASGDFDDNYLAGGGPKVVHSRILGYSLRPRDVFVSSTGVRLLPLPLNRGLAPVNTYTWRDTALLARGADGEGKQAGIPLEIEAQQGVVPEAGTIAGDGEVPSIGLPLLMEFACFPANGALGVNRMDVSSAISGATTPAFRALSAGSASRVVLPSDEPTPRGGFDATGQPTPASDNLLYIGQLDVVARVSRIHSVWLDAGIGSAPTWHRPVIEPAEQPSGTAVRIDYRATDAFEGERSATLDAGSMDAYGELEEAVPVEPTGWSPDIAVASGKRFLQLRITLESNVLTGIGPTLDTLALAYEREPGTSTVRPPDGLTADE